MNNSTPDHRPSPSPHLSGPTFRSGAVARIAGMPVATLRIWEQRYQAVRPTTTASGHRLYSQADVERVTLLRRLTEQGHAIGLLAALDDESMRHLLRPQHAAARNMGDAAQPQLAGMRIVVVGQALATRLQRLASRAPQNVMLDLVGEFDSLADAAQAARQSAGTSVDLLLWQTAGLQPDSAHELRVVQDAWGAQASAVIYRYSSAAARAALLGNGASALQEPADDGALGRWLASLQAAPFLVDRDDAGRNEGFSVPTNLLDRSVSAPRFGEAALTEFAALPSTIACECPSHLAQLLLQVASFETYSGGCASRSAADAQLHAYLQHVAGAARMLFECALERVAAAEGLPLPAGPHSASSFTASHEGRAPTDPSIESTP